MGLSNPDIGGGIQFKFHQGLNLRRKNGAVPNAAVYACYENATSAGRKTKSLATAYRKARNPQWFENTERLKGLTLDTKLTFVVLDSTAPFLRPVKLALSKAYTLSDLLKLRDEAAAQNGHETAPTFAVPLTLRANADPTNEASLVLALFDYMSDKERREFHAQVEGNWKDKQRKDRESELLKLGKELNKLSSDIPSSTSSKCFVDMASGLLASIGPLFDGDFKEDARLVTDLLSSYRTALSQVRAAAHDLSADTRVQLYGKVCLEISTSVRFLERCLRKPALMNELQVVKELRSAKVRFDQYPQTTGSPLGSRNLVFQERATLRKILNDSRPTLPTDLQPSLETEPTKLPLSLSSRHSLATVQGVSSWALLSSRAEVKRLLWLAGPAGCGKTQLTTSLIDAFGRVAVPTVYFTFNNHSSDCNNEPPSLACMARTIAFQLAAYVDGLAIPVSSAVRNAGELERRSFGEIFDKLVVGPLQAISNAKKKVESSKDSEEVHAIFRLPEPVVVVLDDIDQCSPAQLDELLPVLEEALPKLPKEARIMLCSRELDTIRTALTANAHASIVEYTSTSDDEMEGLNSASFSESSAGSSSGIDSAMWTSTTAGLGSGRMTPQTPSRSSSIRWSSDNKAGPINGSGGTGSRRNSVTDGKGKGPASRPGSLGNIVGRKGIPGIRK